jgi:hypothetical protein
MDKQEAYDSAMNYHNKYKSVHGDIEEHLDTLLSYAKQSESITEMGVRFVVSTWSFVLGQPKKLISIDIDDVRSYLSPVFDICKSLDIDFKFIQGDTLQIDIEETDLLFIDTLHTYDQLRGELNRHGNKAKKWIIFHDTETFKDMVPAIDEFLSENKHWYRKEVFTNNNGLTVLERIHE